MDKNVEVIFDVPFQRKDDKSFPTHVRELKEIKTKHDRFTPGDQMTSPGDFYYSDNSGLRKQRVVVMNCPSCNQPGTYPLTSGILPRGIIMMYYRLINFRGEPLTMEPGLTCPYCQLRFKIHHGEITRLED